MDAKERLLGSYKDRSINPDRLGLVREVGESPILDVGCAGGGYIDALGDEHTVIGVDVLDYEDRSWIIRGDATALPFADDSFSTVLLFEVLEHIADDEDCLGEIARVARDRLLLSVPNAVDPEIFETAGLAMHPFVDPTHVNFYNEEILRDTLEAAGFTIERLESINSVYPGMLALHTLGVPDAIARKVGRRFSLLPWYREYYMTLLVHATL